MSTSRWKRALSSANICRICGQSKSCKRADSTTKTRAFENGIRRIEESIWARVRAREGRSRQTLGE
eukprot:6172895-Pleurochrysis_carterae.AAC.1